MIPADQSDEMDALLDDRIAALAAAVAVPPISISPEGDRNEMDVLRGNGVIDLTAARLPEGATAMPTTQTNPTAIIEDFNARYPIGTPVRFWTCCRDDCEPREGQTRSTAQLLGGHTAVVWVTGVSSCIALTHVDVIR